MLRKDIDTILMLILLAFRLFYYNHVKKIYPEVQFRLLKQIIFTSVEILNPRAVVVFSHNSLELNRSLDNEVTVTDRQKMFINEIFNPDIKFA